MALLFLALLIAFAVLWYRYRKLRDGQAHLTGSAQAGQQYNQQAHQHIQQLQAQIQQMAQAHAAELTARGNRAVAASRGSFDGHIAEQAFPVAPDHAYHPKDVFHLGGIADYVVVDGLYRLRHEGGRPEDLTVVFVEVKWNTSRPSAEQTAVLNAMNSGRTRGEVWTGRQENNALTYQQRTL